MKAASEGGLLLAGEVLDRRRRTITGKKAGEADRFVIALSVTGAGHNYTAEMWSDSRLPDGVPNVGDRVAIPVEVRAYVQGGLARHTLVFGKSAKGESF